MFATGLLSFPGLAVAAVSFIVYISGLYIYRAYFDSLSKFPGPKLAAATLWYEFYYDVVKKGQYTFEIGRMHERYGTPRSTLEATPYTEK